MSRLSVKTDQLHMQDVPDHVLLLPTPISPEDQQKDILYVDANQTEETHDRSTDYAQYTSQGTGLLSIAKLNLDGQISMSFDLKKYVPDFLPSQILTQQVDEFAVDHERWRDCPNMNIVIMIVGSRGDVQPYVALGQQLVKDGHRVRIATHGTFQGLVTDAGLEFFSIGGDPQDLMSYMVKNPGLMPGFESLTNGDILKKRKMLTEMINGCWLSCHSPCPRTGRTFAADAIISNPPAFAHVHCAEALGIPLLMSFTMPWSPTTSFSHPLVNITASNAGYRLSNYLSYAAADLLTWQGIGDIINTFRTSTLGLSPLTLRSGPGIIDRFKVPWTYCMSPSLVPKPDDWKNHIDVVGFYFLDLAVNYQPPPELLAFLEAGETPIYIGFGSVVVDDPAAMSQTIFDATEQAGVRALVSVGWGGLGGASAPAHTFMLGNIPHDWLFDKERVSAVVHHGGAGTTAIGLAKGRPTVVVPFFGDQAFWGNMIYKAGTGPKPIPHKELSVETLRDAIKFAISPSAKEAAKKMAHQIQKENGVQRGVDSFYRHLPLLNMRCDLDSSRLAVWWSAEYCLRLSTFAAQTLADAKRLTMQSLSLHRPKEYGKKSLESSTSAIFWKVTHLSGLTDFFRKSALVKDTVVSMQGRSYTAVNLDLETDEESKNKDVGDTQDDPKAPREEAEKPNKKNKAVNAIKGTVRQIVSLSAQAIQKRSAPPTTSNESRSVLGLMAQHAYAWKSLQSSIGRSQEKQHRRTRLVHGEEAVRLGTEAQRLHIINRFEEEIRQAPQRKKLYQEAIDRDVEGSKPSSVKDEDTNIDREGSVEAQVLSSPQAIEEDDDVVFARKIELAKEWSLGRGNNLST